MRTTVVCDNRLYLEHFEINPAGVNESYLTDSLNFRIHVGKYDSEHENIRCVCNGDSVFIQKIATIDTSGVRKVIELTTYSLSSLKERHDFK